MSGMKARQELAPFSIKVLSFCIIDLNHLTVQSVDNLAEAD